MNRRTARWLAWSLVGLAVGMLAAGFWLSLAKPFVGGEVFFAFFLPLFLIGFAWVGGLIAARQPSNPIGWIFVGVALVWGLALLAAGFAVYASVRGDTASSLVRVADWIGVWAFVPGIYVPVTFLFLLFPDGRLPSRRWRPVAWLSATAIAAITMITAFGPRPLEDAVILRSNPYAVGDPSVWKVVEALSWPAGILGMLLSVVALIVRLRRSVGDQRERIKWLAYAGVVVAIIFILTSVGWAVAGDDPFVSTIILPAVTLVALFLIPVAAGVAILKHRLYDIDLVIRKTVVFGVFAGFITVVYAAAVLLVPLMVFGAARPVSLVPAIATVVVALAFQPLRRRANRFANRLVYGKRATPYELLSEFSERVGGEYAVDEVLPRMARVIGEGTGARRAEVWVRVGEELRRAAVWPSVNDRASVRLHGDALPPLPDVDLVEPVFHRGDLLGALSLAKPRGETVTHAEEKLLTDLAAQAGIVLRNVRLTEQLQERLRELQESRQRLVAAQDEERRRLERNLHDGAQQQLVALAVKLRLLKGVAAKDPPKAEHLAEDLLTEAQDALENLRGLARGIYPPLLADKGLPAALESQARRSPIPVGVEPDGVGRYPAEIEATVYFCVLEALQNVAKYANASSATVQLAEEDGHIRFTVTDDGRGFDVDLTPRGAGLQNMADRLEAVGGTLAISSMPGAGTRISGSIPVGV